MTITNVESSRRRAIKDDLHYISPMVNLINSFLIPIEKLHNLGLDVVRTDLAHDKESIQFDPCFFLPQPVSVLTDHEIIPDQEPVELRADSYEDILAEILEEYPDMDNPEEAAQKQYEYSHMIQYLCHSGIRMVEDHISYHLDSLRSNIPTPYFMSMSIHLVKYPTRYAYSGVKSTQTTAALHWVKYIPLLKE